MASEPGGLGRGVEGRGLDGDELILLKKGGSREAGEDGVDVSVMIGEMNGVRGDVEVDDAELVESVNRFCNGADEGVKLGGGDLRLGSSPCAQAYGRGGCVDFDAHALAGVGGLGLLE